MGVAIDRRIASPWSEVSWLSAAQTRWVVARLLELGGVFFAVTPLPGDRFAIGVKPEWENTLLDIVRAERRASAPGVTDETTSVDSPNFDPYWDQKTKTMTIGEVIRALKARVDTGKNDPEDACVVVDQAGDKRPIVSISGDDEAWIEWDEWEAYDRG